MSTNSAWSVTATSSCSNARLVARSRTSGLPTTPSQLMSSAFAVHHASSIARSEGAAGCACAQAAQAQSRVTPSPVNLTRYSVGASARCSQTDRGRACGVIAEVYAAGASGDALFRLSCTRHSRLNRAPKAMGHEGSQHREQHVGFATGLGLRRVDLCAGSVRHRVACDATGAEASRAQRPRRRGRDRARSLAGVHQGDAVRARVPTSGSTHRARIRRTTASARTS